MGAPKPDSEAIFNRQGRRHYRRTYSVREAQIGVVILLLLAGIAGWVAHRGGQPDPTVFGTGGELLDPGRPPVDRGPLPDGLSARGFRELELSRFQSGNLYEKIDGRADFFRSRGFRSLTFVKLEGEAGARVDVEFYDMGAPNNALGTYADEKAPEAHPTREAGSVYHRERNALYLARGRYYVRAIGSDEGEAVLGQLEHLRAHLDAALEGAERPWAHTLFEGMGVRPDTFSYAKENAMSFGFARHVFSALLDDGETEVFVTVAPDAQAASRLAERFVEGFLSYGQSTTLGERDFVKDRYLGSLAAVEHSGALVFGLRGAPDQARAVSALGRLTEAIEGLSEAQRAAARASLPEADDGGSPDGAGAPVEP